MAEFYNRVFKITPANKEDFKIIERLLKNKKFYPEPTSIPPRPATYSALFDYRQFLIYMGLTADQTGFLVYVREQMDEVTFNTNIIPTLDWTTRYQLSIAPTIELYPYTDVVRGKRTQTNQFVFLHWDYQLFNNK